MPLDPQIKMILDMRSAMAGPPMHAVPVDVVRQAMRDQLALLPFPPTPVAAVAERTIPGPAGELPIRVYTPEGTAPFPVVVFFHGGGFVICNLDTHDALCRDLCAGAGVLVVSVDYRLAPENKFPAAPDDCLAATRWVGSHAAELGGDPTRLAVAGDSAGGNLATVTALRIRDEGGPTLRGQLLFYPVVDFHNPTPSHAENGEGYLLTSADMRWFSANYLNDASDAEHLHAAPLRAPDLGGLPPALIVTAEYDPLRDEGNAYAERLQAAGVATRLAFQPGMIHGFLSLGPLIERGRQVLAASCAWLREVLG